MTRLPSPWNVSEPALLPLVPLAHSAVPPFEYRTRLPSFCHLSDASSLWSRVYVPLTPSDHAGALVMRSSVQLAEPRENRVDELFLIAKLQPSMTSRLAPLFAVEECQRS